MPWNYYRGIAESIGIEEGVEKGYSVAWFYRDNEPEDLNILTQAFLGDEDALERIRCISDEEAEAELDRTEELCNELVNNSQLMAITHALHDDVCVIQGPPGTGKTQTICNILRCLMSRQERPSVAVVSSNGEAIQNVIDLIEEDELLHDCYAYLGNRAHKLKFYAEHNDAEWAADFSMENDYRFSASLLEDYPVLFSTIHSLRKCFIEDDDFDGIFDYVIVDECSQVSNMLGVIAMASARKLVLLGDDKQLPPIFKDTEQGNQDQNIPQFYLDKNENSFMKAVNFRFEGRVGRGFLNQHYRSHPSIIGYCNKYVYDGQLQVCTPDDDRLPIRIRWYEGDYWEKIDGCEKKEDQNLKQIKVFMEDEYPEIFAKIQEDEEYSVCVLSPYKYPLEQLRQEIIEYNERAGGFQDAPEMEETTDPIVKIPQLTIHKAQGRGYDLVVLLTIKDCGSDTWPQRRAMINVAVSRAKKEFVMIASSIWMPPDMQKDYLGYSADSGAEDQKLYLRCMMEYVRDQSLIRDAEGYGLQRSSARSVFDRTPYYREKLKKSRGYEDALAEQDGEYAPELCLLDALCDNNFIRDNYEIFREVPLSAVDAIKTDNEECRRYIENGARFDLVIVQNNKICAIIEVDGAYHRINEEQQQNDALKDMAVATIGAAFAERRYLRFSTEGTSTDEIKKVVEALQTDMDDLPEVETGRLLKYDRKGASMRDRLIAMLNTEIRDAIQRLIDELDSGDQERVEHVRQALQRLCFINGQEPGEDDYSDPVFCDLYLARFGYAYAFEYYVMYDAVLRTYEAVETDNNGQQLLGVTSLACGSRIDAWSLAYALACIKEEEPNDELKLLYHGEDLTEWPVLFDFDDVDDQREFFARSVGSTFGIGADEFISSPRNYLWFNVICFAKFLNEIPLEIVDSIVNAFQDVFRNRNFNKRNEYYICISHSKSSVEGNDDRNLSRLASRIINAININNEYEVDSSILEASDYYNRNNWTNRNGEFVGLVHNGNNEGNGEEYPIFRFNAPNQYIDRNGDITYTGEELHTLNNDFWDDEEVNQLMGQLQERLGNEFRNPIKRAHLFRFQVIKLTRRQGE